MELLESSVFVARHGKVNFVVGVVPIKMYANVPVSYPISAERVIGFKHSFEMQDMFLSDLLDTKLSTMRVNHIDCHSCIHRPGTSVLCR